MYPYVLDTLESVTGWTVLGNDTVNLATTVRHVYGTTAMEFDKANGADNTKLAAAYITKTTDIPKLDTYDMQDELRLLVYVSATTAVDYIFVRLGTSATAYVEYQYDERDITAGKFTCCRWHLSGFASQTGNGMNLASVPYIVVGVAFDAETDTLADIAVQRLEIVQAPQVNATLVNSDSDPIGTVDMPAPPVASVIGGVANAAAPTRVEGATAAFSMDLKGGQRVKVDLAQAAKDGTSPADVVQVGAIATAAAPTYTEGRLNALSAKLGGSTRVSLDLAETTQNGTAAANFVQVGGVANATAPVVTETKTGTLSLSLNSEARVRIDRAEAAPAATAPAEMVIEGGVGRTAFPTAVTDGQTVRPFRDSIGRAVGATDDLGSNSTLTSPVAEAPRSYYGPETLTALAAAGSTAERQVLGYSSIKWSFVVASLEAGQFCTVRAEAMEDGTNYNNMAASGVDTTITANGNYSLYATGRSAWKTRFTLVTDSVGGAVTVTPTLTAGR